MVNEIETSGCRIKPKADSTEAWFWQSCDIIGYASYTKFFDQIINVVMVSGNNYKQILDDSWLGHRGCIRILLSLFSLCILPMTTSCTDQIHSDVHSTGSSFLPTHIGICFCSIPKDCTVVVSRWSRAVHFEPNVNNMALSVIASPLIKSSTGREQYGEPWQPQVTS